jgi:proteasome component ECM29
LKQYKDNADVALIRHFDILYIQQGISRLPVSDRLELLPILIQGISNDYERSAQHASQLFHLILRLLVHFKLPARGTKEDTDLRTKLGVTDVDAAFLSKWFGKLILLTLVRQSAPEAASTTKCPGLSVEEYKFLTQQGKPDAWDPSSDAGLSLTESKALATRFLASGMFKDNEKFFPALFASADTNSRISEIGEDILKRVMLTQDLEDANSVDILFELYFGSTFPEGTSPVKTPLRIRILGVLSKSDKSTTYPHKIAKIVEDGLLSAELNPTNKTAGREASKFRSAIFSLVNFVARRGASSDLSIVAVGLVGNLRAFIQDQGWPAADRDQDMELRGYGYETIGLLAKAAPEKILIEPTLDLLEWLFRSLREDSAGKDVAVSIEEALSSVLGAFAKPFDQAVMPRFRQILLRYATVDQVNTPASAHFTRSTRYVATRFANRCLPYEDVLARWIDILAVSGGSAERHEVVEEGRRGLDPYWFQTSNMAPEIGQTQQKLHFPNFDKLVNFIFAQEGDDEDVMDLEGSNDVLTQVQRFYQHYPNALPTVISFCSQVALQSALVSKNINDEISEDWGRKLDTLMSTDQRARQAFRAFAADDAHGRSIAAIIRASFDRLTRDDVSDVGDIGTTMVRLLSLCPQRYWALAHLIQDVRALEPSILSNNPGRRLAAAHTYGLLASHPDCDTAAIQTSQKRFFEKLDAWKTAVGAEINQISGIVIALGYYFSRMHWRGSKSASDLSEDHPVHQLLQTLVAVLKETRDATLKSAAFSCIDQLSLFHVISPSTIARYTKIDDLATQIYDSAKTGTITAILALGHLSMVTEEKEETEEESDYKLIGDKLHELHEVRQPEVQFSVGEALSCFAIGWDSKALIAELDILHPEQPNDSWDAPLRTPTGPVREKTFTTVLEKTLKGCVQTKPALKKASVIWLLCLLQYCGHKPEMQGYLGQCQVAFKNCLSDRDEVVQEAASRGLGLVYEKGDRDLKDDLVRDLVGSFSDNKSKMAGTVSEDTQLFEPGALPTGDGKSITTYKDIMSLAAEVGDSSLVYRFMSMASNNSIWSSRAAFGRFGLSNIFSDSSVDGYLAQNPKLYPKLYRYRYVYAQWHDCHVR